MGISAVAAAGDECRGAVLPGVQREPVSVGGEHDGGVFEPVAGGRGAGGQWVHLVGTYDGTTVRLYVNGVEAFATAHTGAPRATRRG